MRIESVYWIRMIIRDYPKTVKTGIIATSLSNFLSFSHTQIRANNLYISSFSHPRFSLNFPAYFVLFLFSFLNLNIHKKFNF